MSYFDSAACDRAVKKLIKKQFPEREFVLEDDIIVLTKVDIRSTNEPGETDESEVDYDDKLERIYRADSDLEMSSGDDDEDMDDFIDDRPESELSWHDESENEENEIEDREYDSNESDNGYDGNQTDSSESDVEIVENEDEIDSQEVRPSPSKRPKTNELASDSSSESVDSDTENDKSSTDSSGDSPPSDSGPSQEQPIENHMNTFHVCLLPKINGKSTILRYHGRIGMNGIKGICRRMQKKKFCDLINMRRNRDGFTRLNLMYANARHMETRKETSDLPRPVRRLLIHLIDQWFPLGIPQTIHLDRALSILQCLKEKINEGKVPDLKHSNKFYALIPHQGDNRRRQRFRTTEFCEMKIDYVERMKSAVECLTEADEQRKKNPLDYFIENWVHVELKVLKNNKQAYQTLKKAVENTQHADSPNPYRIANIFHVNNMDPEMNDDFSTQITQNHRYLFHFTFASNLLCILREGLIPSPRHIHSVSRFFGNGIYFWDSISNASLKYKSLKTVYILVCRVALGNAGKVDQMLYLQQNQRFHWVDGEDSIFSEGKQFSSTRDQEEDLNGAKIYCGQMKKHEGYYPGDPYTLYNMYVVPNKNQVRVDYILKLERD